MSRSKFIARNAIRETQTKKNLFKNSIGELRTGWLLSVSLVCYTLVSVAVKAGTVIGLNKMFLIWNINAENIRLAPTWVRLIYVWQGSISTILTAGSIFALSKWFVCAWKTKDIKQTSGAIYLAGFGMAGFSTVMIIGILSLIMDSSRLAWPLNRPKLNWNQAIVLFVSLLSILSEECFLRFVLFEGLNRRWGRFWAIICTCAAYSVIGGGYTRNIVFDVNILLLGMVECELYSRFGIWSSTGFRWLFNAGSYLLLGFGGGNLAIYRIYRVSETCLTGGDAGPSYGLWMTLMLLIWLAAFKKKNLALFLSNLNRTQNKKRQSPISYRRGYRRNNHA